MSTMHRILTSAFGTFGFFAAPPRGTADADAREVPGDRWGALTSSPWMGLYIEEADAA